MLSQEVITDLKKDYSFEEIQKISDSLDKIGRGKVVSKKQAREFIDNEIFSRYGVHV